MRVMREGQKSLMREYNERLERRNKEDRDQELFQIIEKEKRNWQHYVDFVITIALIILVIYAQISGTYNRANVTIDCQGEITMINGITGNLGNKTLEDYGYKIKRPEGINIEEKLPWTNK
jgi:hypothetical protein